MRGAAAPRTKRPKESPDFDLEDNFLLSQDDAACISGLATELLSETPQTEADAVMAAWAAARGNQEPSDCKGQKRSKSIRDEAAKSRKKAERRRAAMSEAEAIMAAKLSEIQNLEATNAALKHKTAVMDRLLKIRTMQHDMIQRFQDIPAFEPGARALPPPRPAQAAPPTAALALCAPPQHPASAVRAQSPVAAGESAMPQLMPPQQPSSSRLQGARTQPPGILQDSKQAAAPAALHSSGSTGSESAADAADPQPSQALHRLSLSSRMSTASSHASSGATLVLLSSRYSDDGGNVDSEHSWPVTMPPGADIGWLNSDDEPDGPCVCVSWPQSFCMARCCKSCIAPKHAVGTGTGVFAGLTLSSPLHSLPVLRGVTKLDVAYLRGLSPQRFLTIMKGWMGHMSHSLVELDGSTPLDHPSVGTLVRSVQAMGFCMKHCAHQAPDLLHRSLAIHMETLQQADPPPGHWPRVLACLELRDTQVQDLRVLWQVHTRLLAKVLEDRQRLQAALAAQELPVPSSMLTLQNQCGQPEHDLVNALMRNLRQTRALELALLGFFAGMVITVHQLAKLLAYSYPFLPNIPSVVSALAERDDAAALPAPGGETTPAP